MIDRDSTLGRDAAPLPAGPPAVLPAVLPTPASAGAVPATAVFMDDPLTMTMLLVVMVRARPLPP
ncbi:hypothetical protein CBM2585_A100028 [Cupriavidus taiwanensis]|nr:hypothetical protein CBM2585_A100028 [Cupriavidus taiwanensis]